MPRTRCCSWSVVFDADVHHNTRDGGKQGVWIGGTIVELTNLSMVWD